MRTLRSLKDWGKAERASVDGPPLKMVRRCGAHMLATYTEIDSRIAPSTVALILLPDDINLLSWRKRGHYELRGIGADLRVLGRPAC